jgi:hypothetical protein
MPKMGRPKLPKGKAHQEVIIFRLTKEENRQIDAAVKGTSHKNKSRWIRETLLLQAERARHSPILEKTGEIPSE